MAIRFRRKQIQQQAQAVIADAQRQIIAILIKPLHQPGGGDVMRERRVKRLERLIERVLLIGAFQPFQPEIKLNIA